MKINKEKKKNDHRSNKGYKEKRKRYNFLN